ncbi:MAG: ATP-binding protein [Cocleimonas sp.]|nr:ATP-binding protein [Cocleimonas sp.]
MKKLPIGIQTFEKIRTGNYAYIDKTAIALRLIQKGEYYFLSRPRRFGKSLFLDTLQDIFESKKALFTGLKIYDKWDWETTYPVIKISFGAGLHNGKTAQEALDKTIFSILERNKKALNVSCKNRNDAKDSFAELIEAAYHQHGSVVILIDEYDKPILDNITDKKIATQMRDHLKNIYSVIKECDKYIRFVFITGVSKFSKINLFSGLNNLNDITINKNYATICGYTHHDLQTTFKDHLQGVDMELLRDWYNGYNYLGEPVYNPFDILLFISNGARIYKNYWWSTGNPSFLLKLLQEKTWYIPELAHYEVDETIMDSFDVDHISLVALLWQTGYLTIKEERQGMFGASYLLGTPNREIQTSLNALFIAYLTTQTDESLKIRHRLVEQLQSSDMQGMESEIRRLFASIPYNNFTNNDIQNYEGYYASVLYAYLASLGFEIIAEDTTNHSRIDITLKLEDKTYLIEIKAVNKSTGKALEQIKEREYFLKYQGINEVYCVGMEFCKEDRNLCLFEWEKF